MLRNWPNGSQSHVPRHSDVFETNWFFILHEIQLVCKITRCSLKYLQSLRYFEVQRQ